MCMSLSPWWCCLGSICVFHNYSIRHSQSIPVKSPWIVNWQSQYWFGYECSEVVLADRQARTKIGESVDLRSTGIDEPVRQCSFRVKWDTNTTSLGMTWFPKIIWPEDDERGHFFLKEHVKLSTSLLEGWHMVWSEHFNRIVATIIRNSSRTIDVSNQSKAWIVFKLSLFLF